jgi:hypothetical protein
MTGAPDALPAATHYPRIPTRIGRALKLVGTVGTPTVQFALLYGT